MIGTGAFAYVQLAINWLHHEDSHAIDHSGFGKHRVFRLLDMAQWTPVAITRYHCAALLIMACARVVMLDATHSPAATPVDDLDF